MWLCSVMIAIAGVMTPQDVTVNKMCPVMNDEEADPEITVQYQGKTVALCCDSCVEKFTANPTKYLARLPQFAASADPGPASPPAAPTEEQPPMPFLGRLHPALVHLPIAALPLALVAFAVWCWGGRETFSRADVVPLLGAAAGAAAGVLSGNTAHDHKRYSPSLHEVVERHESLSTAVLVVVILLVVLRLWRWNRLVGRWRWIYGTGLVAATVMVGITGYLGGSLVFGKAHFF